LIGQPFLITTVSSLVVSATEGGLFSYTGRVMEKETVLGSAKSLLQSI
jgi:hypothetical protein